MEKENKIDKPGNDPAHIAIILDGNGRWAQRSGMPRSHGHLAGSENVHRIMKAVSEMQIRYLTVYAFSLDNWQRPKDEVDYLMNLFLTGFDEPLIMEHNIHFRVLGRKESLPEELRRHLAYLENITKRNTGLVFSFCLNYSSRAEITDAVKALFHSVIKGKTDIDMITESDISRFLQSFYLPEPDFIIRTGGEYRLSNFMLWQSAHAELFFTDKYWPDFTKEDLIESISQYRRRDRRFGRINED